VRHVDFPGGDSGSSAAGRRRGVELSSPPSSPRRSPPRSSSAAREVSVDRDRASDLGISIRDVATTLQILFGGLDLSTFKLFGETYKVMVELPSERRGEERDLSRVTCAAATVSSRRFPRWSL
jgi:multidrug efflux pump subunit AcrB